MIEKYAAVYPDVVPMVRHGSNHMPKHSEKLAYMPTASTKSPRYHSVSTYSLVVWIRQVFAATNTCGLQCAAGPPLGLVVRG